MTNSSAADPKRSPLKPPKPPKPLHLTAPPISLPAHSDSSLIIDSAADLAVPEPHACPPRPFSSSYSVLQPSSMPIPSLARSSTSPAPPPSRGSRSVGSRSVSPVPPPPIRPGSLPRTASPLDAVIVAAGTPPPLPSRPTSALFESKKDAAVRRGLELKSVDISKFDPPPKRAFSLTRKPTYPADKPPPPQLQPQLHSKTQPRSHSQSQLQTKPATAPALEPGSFPTPPSGCNTLPHDPDTIPRTFPTIRSTGTPVPYFNARVRNVYTKDARVIACNNRKLYVMGNMLTVTDLVSGRHIYTYGTEETRFTAIGFCGTETWIGTKEGALKVLDHHGNLVETRKRCHSASVHAIYSLDNSMWTLDAEGRLKIWSADETEGSSFPTLQHSPGTYKVLPHFSAALLVNKELWVARKDIISVYTPLADTFQKCQFHIRSDDRIGAVTCAAVIEGKSSDVYIGHTSGHVSVFCSKTYQCKKTVFVSIHRILAMCAVQSTIWLVLSSGRVQVYDPEGENWTMLRDWKEFSGNTTYLLQTRIVSDHSRIEHYELPVALLGPDHQVRIWNGVLKDDAVNRCAITKHDEYCTFDSITVFACTWNAGDAKAAAASSSDRREFAEMLQTAKGCDILFFGFQELIDLGNKQMAAKSMFRSKRSRKVDQGNSALAIEYKEWLDTLTTLVDKELVGDTYTMVYSDGMMGLFSVVFVKNQRMMNIHSVRASLVKTGLGGLHGNKGALVVRFRYDDTPVCFVNCHLAAGQTSVIQRNDDFVTILESKLTAVESEEARAIQLFANNGNGSLILDHEVCFVLGDMNYRIGLPRGDVMRLLSADNLDKLLKSDQLRQELNRNPDMKLRLFNEKEIAFMPTYKYDVGTNNYDSSSKMRVPAWCDRIFYRAGNERTSIEALDYRRHEITLSDHRPVTGIYKVRVKDVDEDKFAQVVSRCRDEWKLRFAERYLNESD
ncbi:hypothetical protein CANCADRAFT_92605 [Tortispora caseinolytica NRRL Y-17796]|uniref:Inositol polyphosphate-related phosphatase domain-containing protein n=1 Tax=Tortispora caseinolytica NRRL Y-17796 TaxID=767744 RepID=A0A1E4TLY1_9ASCO|nr:hypothetical protein CANCADRAFT_92605 [Tortispora caseinolytica NRRL Y-17796]